MKDEICGPLLYKILHKPNKINHHRLCSSVQQSPNFFQNDGGEGEQGKIMSIILKWTF